MNWNWKTKRKEGPHAFSLEEREKNEEKEEATIGNKPPIIYNHAQH
jgi:hypothetical protein